MRKMLLAISLLQVLTVAEVNGSFEVYNSNSYERKFQMKPLKKMFANSHK